MSRVAAVLIPTLNEAASIGDLLVQLGRLPADVVREIIVADGGSDDQTKAIVLAARANDARIRLIDNPQRIQAAGLNLAAAAVATPVDTLVRIDAHSRYPDDYVPRILVAMTAAQVPMLATRLLTIGATCRQRGIALASNSRIGTGGSRHRMGGMSGLVDHGHHAGIDRAWFEMLDGYDTDFVANEDAEFDLRLRRAGGRVWLQSDITVDYSPRSTLSALARQYWRYGRGRAMTFKKHRERLRLRQMLPPLMVLAVTGAVMLAPILPVVLLVPLVYLSVIAAVTINLLRNRLEWCTLFAGAAMMAIHFAWGFGFITELVTPSLPHARRKLSIGMQQENI